MTAPQNENTGDYGYDLAHEEVRPAGAAADRAEHEPGRVAPARDAADLGGDYEYDEAHDF